MPQNERVTELGVVLKQALASLEENKLGDFLEHMAALGKRLQLNPKLPHYKDNAAELKTQLDLLSSDSVPTLHPRQALTFEALQNAWQDRGLARMSGFEFVESLDARGTPKVCQILSLQEPPYWLLIPVNERGEKQAALHFEDLKDAPGFDDVEELLEQKRLKKPVKDFDLRLTRALRRVNLATLDQRNFRAKADLSKDSRHRIKLGMEAFKLHFLKQEDKAEDELQFKMFDNPPTAREISACQPNTYLVLRPRSGQKARVWFIDGRSKKRELKKNYLQKWYDHQGYHFNKSLEQWFQDKHFLFQVLFNAETADQKLEVNTPNGHAFFLKEKSHENIRLTFLREEEKQSVYHRKLALQDIQAKQKNDEKFFLREKLDEDIRLFLLNEHFRRLDAKAAAAIRRYKTRTQKVLSVFESAIALLAAISYGGVSLIATLVGFFVAAGVVWTSPGLAIAGVLLLAAAIVLPIPATWTNWKLFSTYLPSFFNKIGTEYREINSPKKKALFWGLSLFAIATGIATGALTYTATLAIPVMLGLGAGLSCIFPPLAIAFAAAVMISQTVTFVRNFCDILRKENSWKTFKKPFVDVRRFLRDSNASGGRQAATWAMVGFLCLFTALGLVMSCFTSTRSVGKFFIDQFMMTPDRAVYLGIAISAISSFLSRIYFTLSSAFKFSQQASKRMFRSDPQKFFQPDSEQYKIKVLSEHVTPEKVLESVERRPNEKLIILMPDPNAAKDEKAVQAIMDNRKDVDKQTALQDIQARRKIAYFVKGDKLVRAEKGVLQLPYELSRIEEKFLRESQANPTSQPAAVLVAPPPATPPQPVAEGPPQALESKAQTQEESLLWLTKKIQAQASDEMLAQENRLPPILAAKLAAVGIDSAAAGAFYAWSMLDLNQKTPEQLEHDIRLFYNQMDSSSVSALTASAFAAAFSRSFCIMMLHAGDSITPEERARRTAAAQRVEKALTYYRDKNSNCLFAKPREPVDETRYTSLCSATARRART